MTLMVSRDADGIQAAAVELMEEGLMRPESVGQDRKLSPGYYARVIYLIWLQRSLEAGAKLELMADEVDGIAALASAKAEFGQEHPACGNCGQPQYTRFARKCHECGAEFRRQT
jgi:NADH pyrophosphatase NudC (nudix superfamily)